MRLCQIASYLLLASSVAPLSLQDYVAYPRPALQSTGASALLESRRPTHAEDDHQDVTLIQSNTTWPDESITLCSHLTVDRLAAFLDNVVPRWSGPISLAVYALEASDLDDLPDLSHLSVTLLNPDFSDSLRLRYPINRLRNLALHAAPSRYVLSLDADFIPSLDAHEVLMRRSVPLLRSTTRRTAVVVPAYELASADAVLPTTRREAAAMYRSGQLRLTDALAGHGPVRPDLALDSSPEPHYGVAFETQLEPYILLPRSRHPLYDERFTDQGGDKQAHSLLLNALGTDFVVTRDVWVVHPAAVNGSRASWPADRGIELQGDHFSTAQRDTTRFRYFEDWLPEMEKRMGGATKLRWPNGRSAFALASDKSFGRPNSGLIFAM